MAANRHTIAIHLKPQSHPILARIPNDPTLRVMVFCAGEANGKQDIAFPHQSEIKVNGGEVKANLRGLKNKPGSTLPVDITDELRLKIAGYQNNIEMTYALTTKAGHVQVNLLTPIQNTCISLGVGTLAELKT
jgi:E3 SUMO-protein ligase PIAS1